MKIIQKSNSGQMMLLTVMLIGSSILVFSAIAGYLTLQRIKFSESSVDSAKAVFAADSGLECETYKKNSGDAIECSSLAFTGASIETSIDSSTGVLIIKSIGTSGQTRRAFAKSF